MEDKMLEQYLTIKDEAEAELTMKKSKFIANLFCIQKEDELAEKINIVKKKYRDAKHYVFAYRLSNGVERYSDDGEPNKTAGVPILDILRGKQLYDVLVVVTRYFGGILLGTGGLVKAYSDVAKLALEKATVQTKSLCAIYQLEIPYNDYPMVQRWCVNHEYAMQPISFSETVTMHITVQKNLEMSFKEQLQELLEGKLNISKIRDDFYI